MRRIVTLGQVAWIVALGTATASAEIVWQEPWQFAASGNGAWSILEAGEDSFRGTIRVESQDGDFFGTEDVPLQRQTVTFSRQFRVTGRIGINDMYGALRISGTMQALRGSLGSVAMVAQVPTLTGESRAEVPSLITGGGITRPFFESDGLSVFGTESIAGLYTLQGSITAEAAYWPNGYGGFVIVDSEFSLDLERSFYPDVIPEPRSLTLLGLGALGLFAVGRPIAWWVDGLRPTG